MREIKKIKIKEERRMMKIIYDMMKKKGKNRINK